MSTNLACEFIEVQPGRWYYLLENWDAPQSAFDWREYATAYGPFSSMAATDAHLSANHPNPGGMAVSRYEPGFEPDKVLAALIAKAEPPR
ncbi:hypothetical protein [Nocardia sp. CY41]|uniref:hypothetical protein n=1 Tax=Nocardia sp. CY41 TaxID=2608686 RepID=UPI00135B75D8|nr:hypothetical protein [Nocardia sp. CY41]